MALIRRRKARRLSAANAAIATLRASDLFDQAWYLRTYPDVVQAELDPVAHYFHHGAAEGRDPGPDFDTAFYAAHSPDVTAAGLNPLHHYIAHGEDEGRVRKPRPTGLPAGREAQDMPNLFAGSLFQELSMSDPAQIARYLITSATPAEALARHDPAQLSPKISIVLPIYNTSPRFLREALQSVFAQTYTNWELCMVDDASSAAATIAIVDELGRHPDPRIKLRRLASNAGIAGASHAALELATGEYVAFLDHDDLLTVNALSEVVSCLRNDPSVDYVYTDHIMIDQAGFAKHYARKPRWSPEFLLSTNYIVHFKIVRRTMLSAIGGLAGQTDNVQDFGVTCDLVTAGAIVRHVAKPLYMWREHRSSVAFSTTAKPGIEQSLIQVYDKYINGAGISARQTWPTAFKSSRTGVFQLEFTGPPVNVSLIVLARGPDDDLAVIRQRFASVMNPAVTLHVVSLQAGPDVIGTVIDSDAAMLDFIGTLDTDVVAFASATAQHLGIDWVSRLAAYAMLDAAVGAAGGKVLDPWLQIRSAGMLVDAAGEYRTIGGGSFDNERSHWFIGQVASNVDAVSSQLMATRRSTLIEAGGIAFHAYGDAAGVAYCAQLVLAGYRIVYDPYSRCCNAGRVAMPAAAVRDLRERGRAAAVLRQYESLGT